MSKTQKAGLAENASPRNENFIEEQPLLTIRGCCTITLPNGAKRTYADKTQAECDDLAFEVNGFSEPIDPDGDC